MDPHSLLFCLVEEMFTAKVCKEVPSMMVHVMGQCKCIDHHIVLKPNEEHVDEGVLLIMHDGFRLL